MGRKSRKRKAASGKGPIEVAKAEVDEAKPVPTKESKQTSTPKNGGDAAVGAICEFYDKLVELPLEEKSPALLSHHLITRSTLERVGKPIHIRTEKNKFILEDVLAAVQQKPDMLEVFCNVLRDIYIAVELAQLIQDKYDEDLNSLKNTPTLHTTSFKPGFSWCDNILQGKGVVVVLVLIFMVTMYIMIYHAPKLRPGDKIPAIPDIPTAFTGRNDEIESLIHYVVAKHVRIVGVTGGPGYGKSSIAIVSSHELVQRGIPVYYVSLSEVTSIQTFIMAFLHATDKRKTEQIPEKRELLSWVSALETKTVVVLDNADLLTLRDNDLKNDFQKLLKDVVAGSVYIHLVVATRYRLIIANDFEEIHLNPLTCTEAVTLLRRVVVPQGQNGRNGYVEDEHLESIANRTGGIPLAVKVVGILVKLRIVSTAQVLEELAVDPLHTFSRDSISPDEQLNRCFNLSYKYLSPILRKCLIYASRFPGTFDRYARNAVIANLTGDAHCLDQLVDRSLVEYSTVEERYAMHSLLRTFVANSVTERPPKQKYFRLFCSHFILLLSTRITVARTGGGVNHLYNTIRADYHNFLHLLHIYTNVSKDHPIVSHQEMLLFANQAFDVMKSRFPREPLVEWWTAVLHNACRMVHSPDFTLLAPHFLQLSTKFGNLLLYLKQYKVAGDILLFADQCVGKDITLADSFTTCQHPQAESYTNMLQALMQVYEEDGVVHRVLQVRKRLHFCVDSAPDRKPEELIPNDFCTVGMKYLQEKYAQSEDFHSALQLFDAHYNCSSSHLEAGTDELIKMLENAHENSNYYTQFARAFCIAKRCNMVKKYRKETEWLMKAAEYLELEPIETREMLMIFIHVRLTHLHWWVFNNGEKAVEHGKAAYSLAIKYPEQHNNIWATSLRLGDILHQIDGRHTEAGFYFEEAQRHAPFVDFVDYIYDLQYFAELHIISILFHAGEHRRCVQHYGQWAKLEVASASDQARKIVDAVFNDPVSTLEEDIHSLAVMDSSLDWFLDGVNIAKKFLHACMQKAHSSTRYYTKMFGFIAFTLISVLIVFAIVFCSYRVGFDVTLITLHVTRFPYFLFLPHYSFHYFLFYMLRKHRGLWVPRQLPHIPRPIQLIYVYTFLVCTISGVMITWPISYFGLHLLEEQVAFVYSPSLYYNMTMYIRDEFFYAALKLC